ncbi:hypothetical protein RUM43_003802 [Polyplax serrata]|uniref:Cytochrome-b5 reductase n=1 Tax=Polyplax serrata TaxID=468196 RepID=A0AAN8PHS9_POLSC
MIRSNCDTHLQGNPRNKVALLPGHSLMDWIRLGNSGADLTSVGGVLKDVTEDELAEHGSVENAWIALRGKVYNLAPYMNFHPGGVPELVKGIGKDATKLFTEIHPWVNYESILQKCLVGRLVRSKSSATTDDFEKAFFEKLTPSMKANDTEGVEELEEGCREESVFESEIKMCWCQTTQVVKFVFQCKVSSPQILVTLRPDYRLRILIRVKKKLHVFSFTLEKKVLWPCFISVNTDTGRVELEFTKKEEGFWRSYGSDEKDHGIVAASVDEIEAYHKARIISIKQVTHNVRTFVFKFVEKVLMWVPVGHDVRLKGTIEGMECAKQYTPIPPYLPHGEPTVKHWHQDYICFMVKYYSEGALTPYLFGKREQDIVEIGGMNGTFNVRKLSRVKDLYLIAAGSGLSPMLRLLVWAVAKKDQIKRLKLLFVNRYEEDIIWKNELDQLAKKEKWFNVSYCLSQPNSSWTGLRGRVDSKMLDDFLSIAVDDTNDFPAFFISACGPIKFAEMIQE